MSEVSPDIKPDESQELLVTLDALLTSSFFGSLFAMALALLSNYSPLFWLTGFLALAVSVLLLLRFILTRKPQGGSR